MPPHMSENPPGSFLRFDAKQSTQFMQLAQVCLAHWAKIHYFEAACKRFRTFQIVPRNILRRAHAKLCCCLAEVDDTTLEDVSIPLENLDDQSPARATQLASLNMMPLLSTYE